MPLRRTDANAWRLRIRALRVVCLRSSLTNNWLRLKLEIAWRANYKKYTQLSIASVGKNTYGDPEDSFLL
jgi:hypothetical protein